VAKGRGVRGPYRWLTPTDRKVIEQRLRAGERPRVIAGVVGCSARSVCRVRQDLWSRRRVSDSGFRLSFEERVEIGLGIARGESNSEIARALGRHRSTIGREIGRCQHRGLYRPWTGQRKADRGARRPKVTKLAGNARLLAEVEAGLGRRWSPRQISAKLVVDHPDDREMRISHETIYLSLFVQSRGELRKQLTAQLRTGRRTRKQQGRVENRGRIKEMVSISERPPEVEDRAVPGHWEGDLILGAHSGSAVATLVERQTRFVMLAYLGADQSTGRVIEALRTKVTGLPEHLKLSLTWDQGRELAAHKQFTVDTGVRVFFCDPRSPWQRGSNENTNGLLRQYLPKGADLAVHDQAELDRIAAELNGRPRQTLGWMNPAEKMAELLAGSFPDPSGEA
jgi:transposase, IS30 family